MKKFVQIFSLDEKLLDRELHEEGGSNQNLLDAGKRFIQALRDKGYDVRISRNSTNGLPASLLVIIETDTAKETLMSDFLTIMARFGLPWYRTGLVYS